MKYVNPVIPGTYPNPSICRAGDDFYLVTSSETYFPAIPVFHSKDLLHWRQIGHCITRKSQVDLGDRGRGFAPSIRYHDGVFYMIGTYIMDGETRNFYLTTEDPAGEWSDPIFVDHPYIDPSLFFDDDGKVYFTSAPSRQSEIDIRTGKRLTDIRSVWDGIGKPFPEAPHLYKIGDWYYFMLAEGGTEYGHSITIARSKSPWGPFEGHPDNPIFYQKNFVDPLQGIGHGDFIQHVDGSWWVVFHGFRPNPDRNYYHRERPFFQHLGRETCLAPVTWGEDGWPIIGNDGTASIHMEANFPVIHPWEPEPTRDDFDDEKLRLCWNTIRQLDPKYWSLTERSGSLTLRGSALTMDDAFGSPTFVGRRLTHFDTHIETSLDFEPSTDGDEAGLCVRITSEYHYEIAVVQKEGVKQIAVNMRIGALKGTVATAPIEKGPVQLYVTSDRHTYRFGYRNNSGELIELAQGDTRFLSAEIAGGFTGVFVGMYATGNGVESNSPAHFDWFDYIPQND